MNHPNVFETPEYKRSRRAYRLECMFEYFVALCVTESFLAKLLTSMGLSDALIGVISSLISLAFLFQLFSVFVVSRITNTKRFVIIFHSVGQLFFMALYLLPFLPIELPFRKVLVVVCIMTAYFGNYFVTSMIYRWGNSYVEPKKLGLYSAKKEALSLLAGAAMSLALGYIMDVFEANGNLEGSFVFAAIGILIFCVCDFICLMMIKNHIRPKETHEKKPLRDIFRHTLGNHKFRMVVLLTVIIEVARYMTVGFLGVYRLNDLLFSVSVIQIINIASYLVRAGLSAPFGRFSDKYSYATGIKLALVIGTVAFLFLIFTTPTTRWLIVVYTILYSVAQGGLVSNLMNVTYSYVEWEYFVEASAIKNSIGGVCGFCASLLGSRILSAIQANGNTVFGFPLYAQQLLAIISVILFVVALLFVWLVIEKMKPIDR